MPIHKAFAATLGGCVGARTGSLAGEQWGNKMSQAILDAFNAATTWQAALAAIKANSNDLLDQEHLDKLDTLPDDAGREQAIGMGVNEVKDLFGDFTDINTLIAEVRYQIDVEYAKYELIQAVAAATNADELAVALTKVEALDAHRQELIEKWATSGDAEAIARAEELEGEAYTNVLNEIASHLGDDGYMGALAEKMLIARNDSGGFHGVGTLVAALDAADQEIDDEALLSAFNGIDGNDADGWQAALALIKSNAATLLDADVLAKLTTLPDGGGREKAIGLGVLEIKTLFGDFTTIDDIKAAVDLQIEVEYAKYECITALDAATTAAEMTDAILDTIELVNQHRQDLIEEWSNSGDPDAEARATDLADDDFTTVLAEIVSHLGEMAYMAELGVRMLALRNTQQGGKFFGDGKIITALATADTAIEAEHDATITGVNTDGITEDGIATAVLKTLTVHDEDWGENVFKPVAAADLQKQYGKFLFDAATGDWGFSLNNAAQSLKEGEQVQQTLTVESLDGTATETITVTITGVNDAPVAATTGNSAAGDEDKALVGELPVAADVDDDALTYELVAPVAGLTLNADGTFRYVPAADFNGTVTFQYRAVDEHGEKSGPQTFTLTVKSVNDAPWNLSLSNTRIEENATAGKEVGKLTVSDPEGGSFTYELVDSAAGRFTLDTTGVLKVANGTRLDYEQAASHTIKIRVKDAAGATFEKSLTVDVTDIAAENVTGTAAADVLKGGSGKDTFKGGAGSDMLYGGSGNDKLWGDKGKDVFVFDTMLGTSSTDRKVNFDTIKDFSVRDDSIYLDNTIFKKLGSGTPSNPKQLSKAFFTIGDKAKDNNDYIVYNDKTGVLSYDADGSGRGKAIEIAQLSKKLTTMTNKDFFVI
jgi:VCBS repeat-containing protein